jgi:hypothetical protein
MTGIFEEYDLNIEFEEVPDAPSYDVEDGIYAFEIGDHFIKEWEKGGVAQKSVIFEFLLGDEGKKYSEWFTLPLDPDNITSGEITKLSYLKKRYISLGVAPQDMNSVTREDLLGLTGTLKLKHDKTGKWQNIFEFAVDGVGDEPAAEAAPVAAPAARPARAATQRTAAPNPFKKANALAPQE